MNVKKVGTKFEKDLCKKFAENKIWSRLEYPAEDGSQPFDVKAIYRNAFYAFECKNCENDRFVFDRIEENQKLSLKFLEENLTAFRIYFAFNFKGEWYFREAEDVLFDAKFSGKKSLSKEEIKRKGMTFEEILERMKDFGEW